MITQNQIKKTLSGPEAVEHINNLLANNPDFNRSNLADALIEHFGFFDPCGNKQHSGCLKAMRELEQQGYITLPRSSRTQTPKTLKRLDEAVPEPWNVPDEAGKINQLELVQVLTEQDRRLWNEMMEREHPRGAGWPIGRQIRYLVRSEHGWLGGIGFSSAALQLEDRDQWIGWDQKARLENLHYVINLSRFLVRPSVCCHNLASRLLGMALKQMPLDFESRYGYRPLVAETFVDADNFKGSCFRAANWEMIGKTKGRGRQDWLNQKPETIKDIYVYLLEADFRDRIGGTKPRGLEAVSLTSGIDDNDWAGNEFGGAPLGDKRLSRRLIDIAAAKACQPGASFTTVADGDWPKIKGYYRLIDSPDDSAVNMENILLPHRVRTMQRMKDQSTVLCIQDGSDLNYASLGQCEGLGVIAKNQTGAQTRGLHLHSTMAITTDGLPLGILSSKCTAPELKPSGEKRAAAEVPIEEKKTFSWIEGVRDCAQIKTQMPETEIICVMDREADFYELFDEHRRNCSNVDLLVRAKHDRKTEGDDKLFSIVKNSELRTTFNINIPRQSARPKISKQKECAGRPARVAEVSLRYTKVTLRPPVSSREKESISLYIINISEVEAPSDTESIEWFLLTTREIKNDAEALELVRWYVLRWRVEDWHRVLKSGCKVEDMAHRTTDRLKRGLAINIVIAWRIMLMTLLGREVPELPAEILFSYLEIEVLGAVAKKKGLNPPDCLGAAVKTVAKLGGYIGRAKDPPPGHQIIWEGYMKLVMLCEGYSLRGKVMQDTT